MIPTDMNTLLVYLTRCLLKMPRVTLGLIILSVVLSAGFTAVNLTFKTERSDLIDPEAIFHRRWIRYTEAFGDGSDLVVTVEADQPVVIKEVLDQLGERLSRQPEYFTSVFYKVDPQGLRRKGLQFLTPDQLRQGLEMLAPLKPVLAGKWEEVGIQSMAEQLNLFLTGLQYIPDTENRKEQVLSQADRLTDSIIASIQGEPTFLPPWPEFVSVHPQLKQEEDKVVYLLSGNGKMGFLKAFPVKEEGNIGGATKAIAKMREELNAVRKAYPNARLGLTGIPVLEADEMARSQRDSMISSIVSFIAVGIIMIIGFRGWIHTGICQLMLVVGMAWSFAFAAASVGHLNILSISFAAILIGIGVDFAIHYLSNYLDFRHQNMTVTEAILKTSGTVGPGVFTAGLTTGLAFFCACLTEFLGIAELGIIAGGGIILCILCAFIVTPILIYFADSNSKPRELPTPFQATSLRNLISARPAIVIITSVIVMVSISSMIFKLDDKGNLEFAIKYDANLLNLQADGLDSVDVQKRIATQTDESLLFAVSIAQSAEEADNLADKLRALPSVKHVEELTRYLPDNTADETKLLVQAYNSYVSKLPDAPSKATPVDPATVGQSLERLYKQTQNIPGEQAARVNQKLDRVLDWLESLPLDVQLSFLQDYEYKMRNTIFGQLQELNAVSDPNPITLADLPEALVRRFVSPQGEWLIQIFPKDEIWDNEPLFEFVKQLRTVDPEVTGTPLQNYEASQQIQTSYLHSAYYSLLCITCVLMIDLCTKNRAWLILSTSFLMTAMLYAYASSIGKAYNLPTWVLVMECFVCTVAMVVDRRGFLFVVLTMLPPVLGLFLTFGTMAFLGVDFNPANMIVLPLILGIGVDMGVHLVHDYMHQEGEYRSSGSTMNAIILTSTTTMVGFGSMMLGAHRGLISLGLVLTLGVGYAMIVGMVPLTAFLTILGRHRRSTPENNSDEETENEAPEYSHHRWDQPEHVPAGPNAVANFAAQHAS